MFCALVLLIGLPLVVTIELKLRRPWLRIALVLLAFAVSGVAAFSIGIRCGESSCLNLCIRTTQDFVRELTRSLDDRDLLTQQFRHVEAALSSGADVRERLLSLTDDLRKMRASVKREQTKTPSD